MKTENTKHCKLSLITKVLENFKKDPSDQNQKDLLEMMENPNVINTLNLLSGIEYFDNLLKDVNNLICK